MRLVSFLAVVFFITAASCKSTEEKEEKLARQYCGTCHSFPEPSLLSKDKWAFVMPEMALRMGVNMSLMMTQNEHDYDYVVETLPSSPMITLEDLESITNYYQREAPDSLTLPPDFASKELDQFDIKPLQLLKQRPTITMLRADTIQKAIWMSNRNSWLYKYNYNFKVLDSTRMGSPPSSMLFEEGHDPTIALLGIMDPNDQPKGSVGTLGIDLKFQTIVDSIKRPVYIDKADFNNDKLDDLVVCAFGNFGGALLVYENRGDGNYTRHEVYSLPGARKVVLKDFNNDGFADILAMLTQGDEQISLFTNAGSFRFRVATLLKFPPVYGSACFEITDFNKDGYWDIVYAGGDNADYSIVKKPYHGVRIFLNDGKNQFKESWFHQMYGCTMALPLDFDKDGDIDIAAIAFFPDYEKTPERGFVYFENNGGTLEPYTSPLASAGRWMLIEPADLDGDGYTDLMLSALNFQTYKPEELVERWAREPVDVLVLKNRGKNKGKNQ